MFDFFYKNKEEIRKNPKDFIIFVKRLMPRWLNGIPDSECIAIWDAIHQKQVDKNINNGALVETGSGASTICLCLYSVLNQKKAFTWDINGCRGAELRAILNDTIGRAFNVSIWDYWTFVNSGSTDSHLGLGIIEELNLQIEFGFFDSLHTSNHLLDEINVICPNIAHGGVIAIDDANYNNIYYNYQYTNIFRKKLGLPEIVEPEDNIGEKYYTIVENLLNEKFSSVTKIKDSYKDLYEDDIFFDYYQLDIKVRDHAGMEKLKDLEHRFDAWIVK